MLHTQCRDREGLLHEDIASLRGELWESEMERSFLLQEVTNASRDLEYADEAVIPEVLRTVLLELRDYRDTYL